MLTQNPLNVTTANPSNNAGAAAKPAQTPVSGASFNQLLSREKAAATAPLAAPTFAAPASATVAAPLAAMPPAALNSASAPAARVSNNNNSNNNNNKQTSSSAASNDNNAEAAADSAPGPSGTAAPQAKAADGSDGSQSVAKDDSKDGQLADAADAAIPLDLLALVASLNQLAQQPQATLEPDTGAVIDEAGGTPHGLTAVELGADKTLAADKMQAGLAALGDPLGAPKKEGLVGDLPPTGKADVAEVAGALAGIDSAKSAKAGKTDELPATMPKAGPLKDAEQGASVHLTVETEIVTTISSEKIIAMPAADKAALSDLNAVHAPNAALLAPAALQMSQAAALPASEKLTPAVGSPGWDQALGQKVVWMVAGGLQSATLTLNPPDLGPLQVVVHVNNDQASASFNSNQPEVRAALEAAMPKLHTMMNDAGISLASTTVGTSMAGNSQSTPNEQRQPQAGRFDTTASGSGSEQPLRSSTTRVSNSGSLGLVDTFA